MIVVSGGGGGSGGSGRLNQVGQPLRRSGRVRETWVVVDVFTARSSCIRKTTASTRDEVAVVWVVILDINGRARW